MLSTILASNDTCFNETKTVYYKGTSVPVDLPPVTTIIGGWQSATVSMYITKILLEEKMGVEVLLWPTASENYTAWYEYDDRYPVTQYEWLNNRSIDYITECWEITRDNEEVRKVFNMGNIWNLGNLGTISEMYIFVPAYTMKEHVTLGWWKYLHEENIIDIFLNDTLAIFEKYKSDPNFFSRFSRWTEGSENRFDLEYANSSTVQTRPFIFASNPMYQMSKDLWDRMHKLGLSNTWDLWFVYSEKALSSLLEEMVAEKMNFIAHLYSPHNDLGAFDLEKLNFPFPQDPTCHDDKTCETQIDTLFKTVNIKMMKDIPEVATFLFKVKLSNLVVNSIIAASNEYDNSSAYDSACNWLLENPGDWSSWIEDIQRELPIRLVINHTRVIVMWIVTALFAGLTLIALIYLLQNREKSLIRIMSPEFLALASVSGILVAFGGAL